MPQYYWFNIGKPAFSSHQDWWEFLRREGIITVGFEDKRSKDGKPDIGEKKIREPNEGDIILAYASRFGPVGYGVFGPETTYRHVLKDVRPDMRHQRSVAWKATVDDLTHTNSPREWLRAFGLYVPVGTASFIKNGEGAKGLCAYFDGLWTGSEYPDEIPLPGSYPEGAKRQITVNAYERSPEARAKCLEMYGYACTVCAFNFKNFYGEAGEGLIHVHHLIKLADIGVAYVVDPAADLRPVCANCHTMIHRRKDHYKIEEVREMIAVARRHAIKS